MVESDEEEFVRFVFESNDYLISLKDQNLTLETILHSTYQDLSMYYIASPNSCINKFNNGFVDHYTSDVIEFSRSRLEQDHTTFYWRLWAEFKYFDEKGEVISKDKWFSNKFETYRKWIKKNYRISKDKNYYIGEHAYELYTEGKLIPISSPTYIIEF